MTASRPIASRFVASSDTLEHVFQARLPPLAAGLKGRFAVVQRPLAAGSDAATPLDGADAAIELLSITPANELLHVSPDVASASGWREQRVALPMQRSDRRDLKGEVVEIDAFYQAGGIFALLHYAAEGDSRTVLPMRFDAERGWRELVIEGNVANALYKTRQAEVYRSPAGKHFFYGVSTAYEHPQFVVVFETENGALDSVYERVPDPQATYRLLPGDPGGDPDLHACLRIDAKGVHLQDFTLEYDADEDEYFIEWGDDRAHADLGFGALTAANVFPFPSMLATQSLMVVGQDRQLHYVAGYVQGELRSVRLSGGADQPGAIAQLTLGRDDAGRALVFALDAADSRLWVLRQSGIAANGDMTFAGWVRLGNRANVIASPLAMRDGAELFLVDAESLALEHMRQDRATTFWANSALLTATADTAPATLASAHAVEIEVQDADGAPVPNASLELRSGFAAELNVNGFTLHANATRWLPVSADASGRVTVYMPANDLEAPPLHLRFPDGSGATVIDPGARIAERLRDKDPRITVATPQLRAAGLIPAKMPVDQADAVAEMLRHIGRNMSDQPSNETRRLHLRSDGDQLSRVRMSTLAIAMTETGCSDDFIGTLAADAEVAVGFAGTLTQLSAAPPNLDGGEQVLPILGDLMNMFKNMWESVREFVLSIGKGIAELIITLGNEVFKIVVSTVKGIAKAAEALFETLANLFGKLAGEAVKHLVKFVTALFQWDDIVNTNEVLKFAVNQTLDGMSRALDVDAVNWVGDKVKAMTGSINAMFDKIEEVIGPLDPTNPQRVLAASPGGRASVMLRALGDNAVAANMVSNQMVRQPEAIVADVGDGADFDHPDMLADDDPVKQFVTAMDKAYKDRLQPEVMAIFKDWRPTSAGALLQGGLIRTLRTLRPLMVFAVELGGELLKLALRALSAFIQAIRKLLARAVDLNLISAFYQHATGKPLTVLDLMSLVVAVPLNLIYKLFNKLQPPFTAAHVAQLQRDKPMWSEMFRLIHRMMSEERDRSGGVKITEDMRRSAKAFADGWRKPAQWLTLGNALTDFTHGKLMAAKHAVDSKEITGKAGTAISIVTYLVKTIRFVVGLPAMLVTLADIVVKLSDEILGDKTGPGGPFTLPYTMSLLSLLFTIIGFGLMILALIWPMPTLVFTVIVNMIESSVLGLAGLYTLVALIHNGIVTGGGWTTSTEALDQIGSWITMLPGLLSFIPPMVPLLNTAYGLGEVLLVLLMIVDGTTGYASGAVGIAGSIIRIATV
jgi:hypothetical protein